MMGVMGCVHKLNSRMFYTAELGESSLVHSSLIIYNVGTRVPTMYGRVRLRVVQSLVSFGMRTRRVPTF
jgi:hypothetical protein